MVRRFTRARVPAKRQIESPEISVLIKRLGPTVRGERRLTRITCQHGSSQKSEEAAVIVGPRPNDDIEAAPMRQDVAAIIE